MIHFGTSGHRGLIGDGFTIDHVRAIAHATADYLFSISQAPGIIIGYDPRSGNDPLRREESFTRCLTDTLTQRGIPVYFCKNTTPTPVVSFTIERLRLTGGLILTASHNPPAYNGIKFNPANGAPAPESVTRFIQDAANGYFSGQVPFPNSDAAVGQLNEIEPESEFCKFMIESVKILFPTATFNDIQQLAVAIDVKFGTAAKTWQFLLNQLGVPHTLIHSEPRSDFGGIETNPTLESALTDLRCSQKEKSAVLAIGNDPDADRHILLDELGHRVSPEDTALVILDYAVTNFWPVYGIVTTLASSGSVKRAASQLDVRYEETAVGFKYFAPFLEAARTENQIGFGVESSGGFSASFHTLEKCGFLPGVLIMVIMAATGKTLSQLVSDVHNKFGHWVFLEKAVHFEHSQRSRIVSTLKDASVESLSSVFSEEIREIQQTDGLKIQFRSGAWVLVRLSGTEPVARVYAEAEIGEDAEQLVDLSLINLLRIN